MTFILLTGLVRNTIEYTSTYTADIEQLKKLPGEGVFATLEIKSPKAKFHPAKYLQLIGRIW